MSRSTNPSRISRRTSVRSAAGGLGIAAALAMTVLASRGQLADRIEAVRSEIPEWAAAAVGRTADATDTWSLEVAPKVLRAAELLIPDDAQSQSVDRWWFPAEITTHGRRYSVRAQLLNRGHGDEGVRIHFPDRARPDGTESIEFGVVEPARHGRDWLASQTAREVGLIAPPTGFARLIVNGGEPQLVYWREHASTSMLQRLGYPKGDVFRASAANRRGPNTSQLPSHYVSDLAATPARAHAAALEKLVLLVDEASAAPLTAKELAAFELSLSRVASIDKILAWEALTKLFNAPDARTLSSDWYFDPITGLLEPVFSSLLPAQSPTAEPLNSSEAGEAAHLLLASSARRAQRDALLREWTGTAQSLLLAKLDERLGSIVAGAAASGSWYARAADLTMLAQLRRGAREGVAQSAGALRSELAALPHAVPFAHDAPDKFEASAEANALASAWAAASGLPFVIEGEWLRLPAGSHVVTRTLVLPDSHRLLLEPGTHLVMAPDASLITYRGIKAVGTRRAPIEIRALDPDEPWGTIGIARAPETSEFDHVTISGGSDARHAGIEFSGQLSLNGSNVVIRDCDVLYGVGDDSASVKRGSFQISRSRFIDNKHDGFDAEWSTGSIEQSLFASNGDDGLDLGTSEVRVHRTWFRRMGDKAISAGERSRVSVTDSQFVDSQIAIASKEDSRVEVRGSEFRRNEIGVSLYRDNAIFGSGYGVISGGLFSENLVDFAVETGSGLTLNGVERRAADHSGIVVGLHDTAISALSTPSALQ